MQRQFVGFPDLGTNINFYGVLCKNCWLRVGAIMPINSYTYRVLGKNCWLRSSLYRYLPIRIHVKLLASQHRSDIMPNIFTESSVKIVGFPYNCNSYFFTKQSTSAILLTSRWFQHIPNSYFYRVLGKNCWLPVL